MIGKIDLVDEVKHGIADQVFTRLARSLDSKASETLVQLAPLYYTVVY